MRSYEWDAHSSTHTERQRTLTYPVIVYRSLWDAREFKAQCDIILVVLEADSCFEGGKIMLVYGHLQETVVEVQGLGVVIGLESK